MTVVVMIALAVSSCEDDGSTEIGLEGLNDAEASGVFRTDTLYISDIVNRQSFLDSINTSNADRWYVGRVGSYEFKSVMRFFFTSDVESVTVRSATLKLVAAQSYGGSGSLTLNLHALKKSWTADDLRWNRFQENVDYGPAIATTTLSLPLTEGSIVTMSVPRDTVQHWIWGITDSNRAALNYGLILTHAAGATVAQQFYSANILVNRLPDTSRAAFLDVDYQKFDPVSQQLTQAHAFAIPTNLSGNEGLNGFVYKDDSPPSINTITVGGGLPYHANLKFNAGEVAANGTISNAVLEMHLDPAGSFLFTQGDSVALQAMRVATDASSWAPGSVDLHESDFSRYFNDTRFSRRITDDLKDDTLRINITNIVHEWIVDPSQNFGLRVFSAKEHENEFNHLFRVRFIADPADRVRSPKIILTYTLPPNR